MSSIPIQIAETIQTASINKHPDADHDINPSTAASVKIPVTRHHQTPDSQTSLDDLDDVDSISSSVLGSELGDDDYNIYRQRRRMSMPPLPDLRFEQSYLASISGADTWGKIAFITIRDQILLPLAQGTLWTLALHGWKFWNRGTKMSGQSVGARVRRWWWDVNNWKIDDSTKEGLRRSVGDPQLASRVGEYYEMQGGAGGD